MPYFSFDTGLANNYFSAEEGKKKKLNFLFFPFAFSLHYSGWWLPEQPAEGWEVTACCVCSCCESFYPSIHIFAPLHVWVSCESLSQLENSALFLFFLPPPRSPSLWRSTATPPLRSRVVALMPLWPLGDWGDWELSITGRRAGSLLKRAHVGQKEGWQECGGPAEWREGSQLAGALSGLFYLSGWSPGAIVPAV